MEHIRDEGVVFMLRGVFLGRRTEGTVARAA